MSATEELMDCIARDLPAWMSAVREFNEQVARQVGVGTSDLYCLHELLYDGPLASGQLARRLRLTTGAITRMIDRLEEVGLARRIADPADRRRVLVEAIPGGVAAMVGRYEALNEQTRRTLLQFSRAELEIVARFVAASVRDATALVSGSRL